MRIEEKLDELILHLMDVANNALVRDGQLRFFGALLRPNAEIVDRGYYAGERFPEGSDEVAELQDALKTEVSHGKAIAIGLASDAYVPPEMDRAFPDAVLITVETEGTAYAVYFPYHIRKTFWQRLTGKTPAEGWEPRFQPQEVFQTNPKVFTG